MSDKSKEMQNIHSKIWKIADGLRGAVDGWDFKTYVLITMFYRYLSEDFATYINKDEDSIKYENLDDATAELAKEELIKEKGYFIKPSELFCNIVKNCRNDDDLNIHLATAFQNIEESTKGNASEETFAGLFDDYDTNSKKLGATLKERNKRLADVLEGIAEMELEGTTDKFGDAFEFCMSMYASNAGKSGGEYFTPQEVSELLVRLCTIDKTKIDKIYDPACGSGSLLLQPIKVLGKDNIKNIYGQELNPTTYNLARINMHLHGIEYNNFDITHGDTLINPQHDEQFDVIVSNPPYSTKWEGDSNPVLAGDERFNVAGVLAPKSKADLAFIMHIASRLKASGTAAVVCFPGIFYRGGAEQKIRKYLVDNNFIDAVIQLPENLFFGTSISTCIMVMKKNKQDNKIKFIDASKEFVKITNSNMLTKDNIENIIKYYKSNKDIQYIVKIATRDDVEKEKYNLSVSTYVEKEDTREKIDIKELNKKIDEIVAREDELRKEIDKIISMLETKDTKEEEE